jgi:type IV pilus assembly protein PilV
MPVTTPRAAQSGSFLLEALIAILIVALGVLGSIGLLARSMQDIDDAKYRGEAAYLANMLVGQMWVSNRDTATLTANFASTPGTGAGYTDWRALVDQRLPNASGLDQDVDVAPGPIGATSTNSVVTVTLRWQPPGQQEHRYDLHAVIGANN